MKLHLSNLGAIKHGEIELGDITLFVGKPNTGKSTAMKALFYSLYCPGNLIKLKQDGFEVKDNLFLLRFTIDREATEENYKNLIRDVLPEGEFKLEPTNVLDFILTQKLSYEENYIPISLPSMYFSKKCNDKDIKRLMSSFSNAIYRISVNGDEGEAIVRAGISDVKQTCLNDEETLSSLSTAFMETVQGRLNYQYCKGFNGFLREKGIDGITYNHYSRSFLTLQNLILQITKDLITYDKRIFNLIKPLLKGQIANVGGNLVYTEENKIIPWDCVSASTLEIVSFLLSVKEGNLVLYEEPEAHLHEELQLLMAIVLYALSSSNRIVISTHSQSILYTIAHLSMLKPTKEELKNLFESIKVKDYEALVEAVEEANNKEVKVKVYHFTEGEVKDMNVDEAVKGMPGTIDVLEKEFKWFSSVHSKMMFKQG